MKFSSELIKKAWQIRKQIAAELNCKVMEVLGWGEIIEMAKEEKKNIEDFGNVWEKYGKKRVYFTFGKTEDAIGLVENDEGYYLKGKEIPYSEYCYICQAINGGFYDCDKKVFGHKKEMSNYMSYLKNAIGEVA